MALSSFSFDTLEAELRALCDCTPLGTDALKAVVAVRRLGFPKTAKYTLTFEELKAFADNERYPIVFVNLAPIDGIRDVHALVVLSINAASILVHDPAQGERLIPRQTFNSAWAIQRNLAIIVEK